MTVLILGGLASAHGVTVERGADATGVLLVLDNLFSLALVLAVFGISAAVGGRFLKAGGVRMDDPLEELLFGTAVGLGTVATLILGVGSVGGAQPVILFAVLAAVALLGWRELRGLPALVAAAASRVRAGTDRLSLSLFGVIALLMLVGALVPPTDWDVLMYHLRVPDQFLVAGAVRLPEDNGHVAFVGLPHMLFLPFLAAGSPAGPALVSAVCTLGLALATFAFGTRFLDQRTAGLSLAVVWGSTILVLVGVTARTDTVVAFYLVLAHYAVIRAAPTGDVRHLYLGAALGGMAIGVKYTALVYLVALAPLAAWIVMARVKARPVAVTVLLCVGLAAALPWLLKNAMLLGDPLYPYLSGPRVDPWIGRLYGDAAIPPHVHRATLDAVWGAQAPFNLVDFFKAPERIAVEAEGASYHANLLLLLLPLWFLSRKTRVLGWLAGPALVYGVLIVVLQPATSLRYLIPALAPLTVVALHAYAAAWDRLVSPRAVRVALAVTALLVLAPTAGVLYRQSTQGRQLAWAVGSMSREAFLRGKTGPYADVVAFANRRLSDSSRMLLLFEARGYYFRVPVLQDNGIVNWPILAPKATPPDCLRAAGVTHVLVNTGVLGYYARRGVDLAPLVDGLDAFAQECLVPIYSENGFSVFRVRDAPPADRLEGRTRTR